MDTHLPVAGFRYSDYGTLCYADTVGGYWSSSRSDGFFATGNEATGWGDYTRSGGRSVRPVAL